MNTTIAERFTQAIEIQTRFVPMPLTSENTDSEPLDDEFSISFANSETGSDWERLVHPFMG